MMQTVSNLRASFLYSISLVPEGVTYTATGETPTKSYLVGTPMNHNNDQSDKMHLKWHSYLNGNKQIIRQAHSMGNKSCLVPETQSTICC